MLISIKEIKFITKNLFLEKTSDSDGFISDFTEPLIKEKMNPTQIFLKTEVKKTFPNLFYKFTIALKPKPDKDITRNTSQYSLLTQTQKFLIKNQEN